MYKMYLQKSTFLFCNYVHFMLAKNIPKPKGRPRVRPITTEEELRKELERLQMENDLLRDFLSEIERK